MKKRKIFISVAVVCVVILSILISACEKNEQPNNKVELPPATRVDYFPPSIYSLGLDIFWNSCDGAVSYDVYEDGKFLLNTMECHCKVEESAKDRKYKVIAKYQDAESDYSNETQVSKRIGIKQSEMLEVDPNLSNKTITISSNIRIVTIESDEPIVMESEFVIEDRTTDIYFALRNVTLSQPYFYSDALIKNESSSMDRNNGDWSVILDIEGECLIDCFEEDEPAYQPAKNSGKRGSDGRFGGNGIIVSSIVIEGNGTLTIKGGNGQQGGKGADANLVSTNAYGHGGNGGNGGAAVKCKYLCVNMGESGVVTLVDGVKGAAGGRGDSSSNHLISQTTHFTHFGDECDGEAGMDGKSVIQTYYVLGGNLVK